MRSAVDTGGSRQGETSHEMKTAYRAVQVSAPGTLRVVERQVSEPGAGQVRIRVEECGISHTDAATEIGRSSSRRARTYAVFTAFADVSPNSATDISRILYF